MSPIHHLFILLSLVAITRFSQASPQVDADIEIKQTYTDNVQQAANNGDSSQLTEISPSISLFDSGAKTDYILNYRHLNIDYRNPAVDDRRENSGFASVNRSEFNDKVRLFANSRIINVDSDVDSFFGDISRSERVETISHAAGVEINTGQRHYYDIAADFQFLKTKTDNDAVDSEGYSGSLTIDEGSRHQIPFWRLSSDYAEEKGSSRDSETIHNGTFGINLIKELSVFIQGTYEKIRQENLDDIVNESWGIGIGINRKRTAATLAYNRTEEGPNDNFVSATLNWQPSDRTRFDLNYGRRFFGETYGGTITHRTRRLTHTLVASDSVRTFSQTFGRTGLLLCRVNNSRIIDLSTCRIATDISDFSSDLIPVTQVTFNDISEEQILSRAVVYSLTYSKSKSSWSTSAVWNRTKRLSESLDSQDYVVQKLGSIRWNWNMTTRTELLLSAIVEKIEDRDDGIDTTNYSPGVSLTRRINQDLSAIFSYTYSKRTADDPDDEFEENQISVALIARF